jgi:hypothetical protein
LRHFLLQRRDSHSLFAYDRTGIRRYLTRNYSHEGRFARAVSADQAYPLTPLDMQRYPIEQLRPAEGKTHIL